MSVRIRSRESGLQFWRYRQSGTPVLVSVPAGTITLLIVGLLGMYGCKSEATAPAPAPATSATTADRLRPDERLPGTESVFGMEVPEGLKVVSRHPKVARLTGHASHESVANHFRKLVMARNVEIGANRTLFPRVYIKGDKSKRLFKIDISNKSTVTNVTLWDITKPPVTQGLTVEKRWEEAGRNPDGTVKDRKNVY